MPIPFGTHVMKVLSHGVYQPEGKAPYVGIEFEYEGQPCNVRVYISDAAADMAHAALKKIGFNTKTQSVYKLQSQRTLCAGNEAEVKVYEDDYGGKVRTKYEISLSDEPITEAGAGKLDAIFKKLGEDEKPAKPKRAPRRTEPTEIEKIQAENYAQAENNEGDDKEF